MTTGIGNPDWQRRYTFSAAPILKLTYPDNINSASGLTDSSGFEYLLVTTNTVGSNTFDHVKIDWFQDVSGLIQLGVTDYTVSGQGFFVQKIPVMTRYFKLEIGPVGGVAGGSIIATIYGTNADQENLLTQNTSIPMLYINQTIGAGTILTQAVLGIDGGRAMVNVWDMVNNKWFLTIDYYDFTTQTYRPFYAVNGPDVGVAFRGDVILPYAPTRVNLNNLDVAANGFMLSIVAP